MKFLARALPFVAFMPMLALAAPGELNEVGGFMDNLVSFMNDKVIPFIFALAFLVFVWGMFKTFILGGSDEDKQKEGKQLMMYAVAGFVLMLSLWGIVNLFADGFGFTKDTVVPPKADF